MCSGMNNGESGAGPLSSGRTSHRGAQRGTGSGHCRWRHCTKVQWTGEGSCAKSHSDVPILPNAIGRRRRIEESGENFFKASLTSELAKGLI